MSSTRSSPEVTKAPKAGAGHLQQLWDSNNKSSRKRKERDEDIEDLKTLIQKLRSEQASKYKNFEESFNTLKVQNEELKKQNEEILKNYTITNNKLEKSLEMYNDLKVGVENMDKQLSEAMIKIYELEDVIQQIERNQKLSMIEINNCPLVDESKLLDVVGSLHNSIGLSSDTLQVRQAHQIKTSKRRTILVEYYNSRESQEVLKAAKQYNKRNKTEKLNAKQLGLQDKETPVYISECLTPLSRKHFFLAREIQKKYGYKFCWTKKGVVYIRKSEEASVIQLKSKEQMENFMRLVEYAE